MRKIIFVLLYGILWGVLPLRAQKLVPAIKPNATQQAMQKRAYGMFIHFGINTFCQQEWSDGSIPALTYNPTNLDCEQWVRVARDAGFRYVLLVTKHHDGFCLWDSPSTTYDVCIGYGFSTYGPVYGFGIQFATTDFEPTVLRRSE